MEVGRPLSRRLSRRRSNASWSENEASTLSPSSAIWSPRIRGSSAAAPAANAKSQRTTIAERMQGTSVAEARPEIRKGSTRQRTEAGHGVISFPHGEAGDQGKGEGAGGARGGVEPTGAARLPHPGDLRSGAPAHRHRGEGGAPGEGPAQGQLRRGQERRGLADRRPYQPLQPRQPREPPSGARPQAPAQEAADRPHHGPLPDQGADGHPPLRLFEGELGQAGNRARRG